MSSFSELSKQAIVQCWCEMDRVETKFIVNNIHVAFSIEYKDFYNSLLERLKLINVDSFRIHVYGDKGSEAEKHMTTIELENTIKNCENKELLSIENIRLLFK